LATKRGKRRTDESAKSDWAKEATYHCAGWPGESGRAIDPWQHQGSKFFKGRVRPLSEIIGICLNHAESSGSAGAGDYRGTQQLGAGAENDMNVFCHRRHLFCNEQFRTLSFHMCREKILVVN